jgi:DNA repair protein RadC
MSNLVELLTALVGTKATKKLLKGLQEIGDPAYLLRTSSPEEIARHVGDRAANKLYAALRLGQQITTYCPDLETIDSPAKAFALLDVTNRPRQESFWAIYLDCLNRVLQVKVLCVGTATETLVDVPELLRSAIAIGATRIVVAHNHPSGSVDPSPEDIAFTKSLIKVTHLLNVELIDSIVVSSSSYFSLKEKHSDIWST